MYEFTTRAHLYGNSNIPDPIAELSVSPDLKFKGLEKGIVPTQVIFCLKETNARKLNSRTSFFQHMHKLIDAKIAGSLCDLPNTIDSPNALSERDMSSTST
jgi:hypothetical protein